MTGKRGAGVLTLPLGQPGDFPRALGAWAGVPKAGDADHGAGEGTGLLQMQVLPGLAQQPMPFLVLAFPDPIGRSVRLWRVTLEALPILAGCPAFARAWGRRPIEDAILRQA